MLDTERIVSPLKLSIGPWLLGQQPLLKLHEVPPHFREPAIISGYRPIQCTPLECIASIFNATNETLNFWTHFLPSWYFIWRLADFSQRLDFINDPYTWPFLAYMLTACCYPLISCTAHMFSSMSLRARHTCFFLDYGSLTVYGFGSCILYRAYSLPSSVLAIGALSFTYLAMGTAISCLCVVSVCSSRLLPASRRAAPYKKLLRLGGVSLSFIWGIAPVVYRILLCEGRDCTLGSSPHLLRLVIAAAVAALTYASHFPERLAPGKFDIIGHSHQLMHIAVVLGTNEQMEGGYLDLLTRRDMITSSVSELNGFTSLALLAAVSLFSLLTVLVFIWKVTLNPTEDEHGSCCAIKMLSKTDLGKQPQLTLSSILKTLTSRS